MPKALSAASLAEGGALLCRARSLFCALPVAHLIETMRPLPVKPVAGTPSFVLGLTVIRGAPVPVVDVGALLGFEDPSRATRFVAVKVGRGGRRAALALEEVLGFRNLAVGSLDALPPLVRNASAEAVSLAAALDAELLVVLETARVVPDSLWTTLQGVTAQ